MTVSSASTASRPPSAPVRSAPPRTPPASTALPVHEARPPPTPDRSHSRVGTALNVKA